MFPARSPMKEMKTVLSLPLAFLMSCSGIAAERIAVAPRTNLLLPLLNLGAEVPLGGRLSVAGDVYYPWFGYDKANANCIQAALADLQLRWWLKPRKVEGIEGNTLTGSSLAVGAYAGLYDLERNYRGVQGEIYGFYLDYGYSFFLARNWRLTISLGAGLANVLYKDYTVYSEGSKLIRDIPAFDKKKQWIGPVHAGVTLSLPIFKGGKRNVE